MRLPEAVRRRQFAVLLCASLAGLASAAGNPAVAAPFAPCADDTRTLTLRQSRACVEVASTEASRQRGLMFRTGLATDSGMVFVFREDDLHRMWMKNTYVALSVAFLNDDGVILNIEDMEPLSLTPHGASGPARYALEMPLGWFAHHELGPGIRVLGLPPPDVAR